MRGHLASASVSPSNECWYPRPRACLDTVDIGELICHEETKSQPPSSPVCSVGTLPTNPEKSVVGYMTWSRDFSKIELVTFTLLSGGFRPPLWSSGQSSWLQIRRPGFDFRHYQIFWEVVGLERGPLSLVSTTEGLLDRKVAAPV
jgi:hypothetical protein